MDAIGGYFELELRKGEHFHKNAICLNSGRNCFEYVLRAREYKRVYMPYYTCDVLYEPMLRTRVERIDYNINEQLEPIELPKLKEGEAFLYTNYFGLKQRYVEHLAKLYGTQLIVDNAQAFYAERLEGIDTFYSPRKFFGVPDGGYLYTDCLLDDDFPLAKSMERMGHLLKRIEGGAEAGYAEYKRNNIILRNLPIERMSKITETILCSIDYDEVRHQKRKNYAEMDNQLSDSNLINLQLDDDAVPMVYPYLTSDDLLRNRLILNKIFVATYWPNICKNDLYESYLKHNLLPLPIDQRYSDRENQIIAEIIRKNL